MNRYPRVLPAPNERRGRVANTDEQDFFYDGTSQPESMVKSWDRVFRKLEDAADPKVPNCDPHRFRDAFAVSLLLRVSPSKACLNY